MTTTFQIEFTYNKVTMHYLFDDDDLDRNYNDEPFAYFLDTNGAEEYDDDWLGFELNILKDANGDFIDDGYLNVFHESWDGEEEYCIPIKIKII